MDDALSLAKRAATTIAEPFTQSYAYAMHGATSAAGKNATRFIPRDKRSLGGLVDEVFTTTEKGTFTGSEIMRAKTDAAGNIIKNAAGEAEMIGTGRYYNYGKMAAGASGLAIGWRFATGGGLYRDKNGNFDIAGVPFI